MAPIFIITRLSAASKAARSKVGPVPNFLLSHTVDDYNEQVVEILTKGLYYSQRQESGVAKRCIAVPWDPCDEKTVYMIKE